MPLSRSTGDGEAIGEPVDLVGHNWGGGHTLNVAMTRLDLLRSWVSDLLGLYDPEYVWHPLAQAWQTPGKGEEAVASMVLPITRHEFHGEWNYTVGPTRPKAT